MAENPWLSSRILEKDDYFCIESSVGTPVYVDSITSKPTIERTFGHFAMVLVDIDLAKDLKFEVLVERKGFSFFVSLNMRSYLNFVVFERW